MQIYSWNVNGLRACIKKGAFTDFITSKNPDIICFQETKAKSDQTEIDLPEYEEFWNSAERPGYSGTAIFTKIKPLKTSDNFPSDLQTSYPWENDPHGNPLTEGRVQTAEFEQFYLVNVYVPNTKRDLSRLQLREAIWDQALLKYLQKLDATKPVIICGDFNAAHTPIDLARPKDNEGHAGYTKAERQGITNYLNSGLIDSFRHFYPEKQQYTWWTNWSHARERNIGWRIDYFLVSKKLLPHLVSASIHDDIMGSDHCPVSIALNF